MYQYSLTWFLQLFNLGLSGFREVEYEAEDNESNESRKISIDALSDYFTRLLYSNVCRSLFEKDKLLFSFLLAAKLAQARGDLLSSEFELLVQSFDVIETGPSILENEFGSWLP